MQLVSHGLIIDKLRLRGAADPSLARLRIEAALGLMEVQPLGLPADAILVVRKLRVRGRPALWEQTFDVAALRSWEEQVQNQIEALTRGAARPALEVVPPDADAVLFANRAEWIACLTSDTLHGRLAESWWFASLVRNCAATQLVVHSFVQHPYVVPAALERVARLGLVQRIAEVVDERTVRALFQQLGDCHGVRRLCERVCTLLDGAGSAADVAESSASHSGQPFAANQAELGSGSRWMQTWVGLALTLAREPRRARARSFEAAVLAWLAGQEARGPHAVAAREARLASTRVKRPATVVSSKTVGRLASASHVTAYKQLEQGAKGLGLPLAAKCNAVRVVPVRALRAQPGAAESACLASSGELAVETLHEPLSSHREEIHAKTPALQPDAANPLEHRAQRTNHSDGLVGDAEPLPPVALGELLHGKQIETELGGVFFLVLVGMRLALYGDIFTPREPGIELPLWDFLALLARELLGDTNTARDPIWGLLDELSGRSADESLGGEFEPPNTWVIPQAWLSIFASGKLEYRVCADRLIAMHEAGFCVLDAPTVGMDPQTQLTAAFGLLGAQAQPKERPGTRRQPALARWTEWVGGYVRARLALALGIDPQAVATLVLRQRARVTITALRIDVTMSLSRHPIELRRAGLDRDVGFIPAVSRTLCFHFEPSWRPAANDKET